MHVSLNTILYALPGEDIQGGLNDHGGEQIQEHQVPWSVDQKATKQQDLMNLKRLFPWSRYHILGLY